jgi:putative transposase
MAKSRYRFLSDDSYPYFLTITTVNWLPLFSNPIIACIIIESLNFLVNSGRLKVIAYVILENHLHLVASSDRLSKEIGDFKSFTARKSIDYYIDQNNQWVLKQLFDNKLKHKTDRDYQFWQEGSHPKRITNEEMLIQKIEYIHQNPVRRGFVDAPEHWRYSSARDYAGGVGLVKVVLGI